MEIEIKSKSEAVIDFVSGMRTCAVSLKTEEQLKELAEPLDLDTMLKITNKVLDELIYCPCYNSDGSISKAWGEVIFEKIITEEDLEKLVLSKDISFRKEAIFEKAIEVKSKKLIVKSLAELSTIDGFDFSTPLALMTSEEKEEIFNNLLLNYENKAARALENRKEEYNRLINDPVASYNNPLVGVYLLVDESLLTSRLKAIKLLLEAGLKLKNPEERMEKIAQDIGQIGRRPNAHYNSARFTTERIKKDFARITLQVFSPEIKGEGLEIVNVKGQNIGYLNGNLVGEIGGTENMQVKADSLVWMKTFEFDRDNSSIQYKKCIFAWKKGWEEPKEIFERHAWTREGFLFVSLKFDGEIVKITSSIDDKDKWEEEVKLD